MTNTIDAVATGVQSYLGHTIYISKDHQRRKHRKKRINKKWKKRYGYYNPVPRGRMLIINGVIYMTEQDFKTLRKAIEGET